METGHFILYAFAAFLGALLCSFCSRWTPHKIFRILGLGCLGLVVFHRYFEAWPMLPMYLGVLLLAFCIELLRFFLVRERQLSSPRFSQLLLDGILVLLCGVSLFFAKDFYLPFIRSQTSFAHLFLITGALGKALLILTAIRSIDGSMQKGETKTGQGLAQILPLAAWGYGLLTISMFCGEVWSFLGWGMPVVWHDPAIAIAMTLWFYWSCVLHLHYLSGFSSKLRIIFTAVGGALILFLGSYPELGPWEPDRFFSLIWHGAGLR